MAHNLNADVARVFVRQQRIEVVDGSAQDRTENCDAEFRGDQPPEVYVELAGEWIRLLDVVDDEFRDPQGGNGNQRSEQAEKQSQRNDPWP